MDLVCEDGFVPARSVGRRAAILAAALAIRLTLGYAFFGSVELLNILSAPVDWRANIQDLANVPYFPTIAAFIHLGQFLAATTGLPLALCFKFGPIVFDSLLAVLIYDFAVARGGEGAFRAGILYAFSPVAVLIACFNVHWDAILLYFLVAALYLREHCRCSRGTYLAAGALVAASVLIKPVAVALLPFVLLVAGRQGDAIPAPLRALYVLAGFLALTVAAVIVFDLMGVDVLRKIGRITHYTNRGVAIFGLPFGFPFEGIRFLHSRLWLAVVVVAVFYLYWRARLGLVGSVALVFLAAVGLAGLSPQYLLWPVPFLLVDGRYRASAVYGFVAATFLIFYFMSPMASGEPWDNMATFAALTEFAWAMPPAWLADDAFLDLVEALGNHVLPWTALAAAATVALRPGTGTAAGTGVPAAAWGFHAAAVLLVVAGLAAALVAWSATGMEINMADVVERKIAAYALTPYLDRYLGLYRQSSGFNVFYWGTVLSVVWSAVGLRTRS